MRRWVFSLATIGLLALCFAALDDITTNPSQESFRAEYLVVTVTAVWCLVSMVLGLRRAT